MSAPDTNVERQGFRHWPLLAGITAALLFAAAMVFVTPAAVDVPMEDQAADDLGVPNASIGIADAN